MGIVAAALRRQLGAGRATTVLALVTLALASEALQRHLPDRTPSLHDLGIDLAGIGVGLLLARARRALAAENRGLKVPASLVPRRRRRRRRRSRGRSVAGGQRRRATRSPPDGRADPARTMPDILLVPDAETT